MSAVHLRAKSKRNCDKEFADTTFVSAKKCAIPPALPIMIGCLTTLFATSGRYSWCTAST